MKWFVHPACRNRAHCEACRTDAAFRASLARSGLVSGVEFDCPHGYTAVNLPPPLQSAGVSATPSEPTVLELAATFTEAMARWTAAGFATVDEATYQARRAACAACELWDGKARAGLGKCKAPGCSCTKFKAWLSTETCKHPDGSRW